MARFVANLAPASTVWGSSSLVTETIRSEVGRGLKRIEGAGIVTGKMRHAVFMDKEEMVEFLRGDGIRSGGYGGCSLQIWVQFVASTDADFQLIVVIVKMDKSWMSEGDRLLSPVYAEGVESHLFIKGIDPNYTQWIFHGEEETLPIIDDDDDPEVESGDGYIDDMDRMFDDIRAATCGDAPDDNTTSPTHSAIPQSSPTPTFDQLLEDARRPLFDGCTKFSKLSFVVKLLHIKTLGGWSIKSFDMLLSLLWSAFPNVELPQSYEEENANLNECPICKASRWMPNTHGSRVIPQKVLRHFPLKPRLQRLFVSSKIAGDMRWHKEQRVTDDTSMRHLADSESWKTFDQAHPRFARDARNVRLSLASDGFNPFNSLAKPYSIWPVILVPYNLPLWLCMKDMLFMTSLIIPSPKSPGNDIDVYLQPLIDELLELREHRVPTYDASTKEMFMLHPALLWTINDFPAYGNLSGWSTKGKMACPFCNAQTDSNWLKYGRKHCYMGHRRLLPRDHIWRTRKGLFNGKEDLRMPPTMVEGADLLTQLQMLGDIQFGKSCRKRKHTVEELNWTKKSIFFKLPYWSTLRLRHNLDVMHIEKNISENILGTLMNIPGKTKDNTNSRRDLEILGFRKELHLKREGERVTMPHAAYTLHGDERNKFCAWLAEVKYPDGFLGKFKRYVKNKAHPKGSIAEAWVHIECLTFCSIYLQDVETKFNRPDRNIDGVEEESIDGEHNDKCKVLNPNSIERTQQTEFPIWFKQRWIASYVACIINGKRFHTKSRELRRRSQNSGVLVTGDQDTDNVDFYGIINDVVELHYMGGRRVYLFSCDWFDVGAKKRGVRVDDHLTSLNMNRTWNKDEPYVLACQASQCFYIRDLREKGNWYVVQKYNNRNVYDIPPVQRVLESIDGELSDDDAYQENESPYDYPLLHCDACPVSTPLSRTDIEPSLIEPRDQMESGGNSRILGDFIDDAMAPSGSGDAYGDWEYSDDDDPSTKEESDSE
ncbi:uncharacterized protein LOC122293618 [Carya illinoinensis]|uniref:uncharacterized protein LOC122293618 n=1 Tax=Carya illinoinensis TaxID=32201 RepID=UPI001C7297BD|nr:uncharacterized protein LOC122293618 [Carya illinoinensis]